MACVTWRVGSDDNCKGGGASYLRVSTANVRLHGSHGSQQASGLEDLPSWW